MWRLTALRSQRQVILCESKAILVCKFYASQNYPVSKQNHKTSKQTNKKPETKRLLAILEPELQQAMLSHPPAP